MQIALFEDKASYGDVRNDKEASKMIQSDSPILKSIVSRITETVQPDKIILFGSRARGDARNSSDFDIMVIKKDVPHRRRLAQEIHRLLHGIPAGVDIIVETPEHLKKVQNRPGLVYETIFSEGIVIYG